MAADLLALADTRLARVGSLLDVFHTIDDWVVVSALQPAILAFQRAADLCESADWENPQQVRAAIDAVLTAMQAAALATTTGRDDQAVDVIRTLRASLDFLIPIVISWLAGNRTFGATEQDANLAGIDPATIMAIVQLAVVLIEWWRKRKTP